MSIGSRTKEIRKAHGIRASYINNKLGRSRSWLSNIESGRNDITATDLKAVADAMRVPVQEFYSDEPYLMPEQHVIIKTLGYCTKNNIDPDVLNVEINKPSGWLQQIPLDITPTQLAKIVNYCGYSLDTFVTGT